MVSPPLVSRVGNVRCGVSAPLLLHFFPLPVRQGPMVILAAGGPRVGCTPLILGPVARWGPALLCLGVPPHAPAARCGRALLDDGSPSPPSLAAARVKRAQPFGGFPSPWSLLRWFLVWGTCAVGFRPPSSFISFPSRFAKAPWSSLLPAAPALAVPPSAASDASKSYLQRASAPCSDLVPSVTSDFRGRGPALPSSSSVSIVPGGSSVRCPPIGAPSPPSAPCILVFRVVGGFSSPPPRPYSPGPPSTAVGPPGVSFPLGSSATQGVSEP